MKELTYHREVINGTSVLLPNLTLDGRSEEQRPPLGRWAMERQKYLALTNLYGLYLIRGTLNRHLEEVQRQAEELELSLKNSLMNQEQVPSRQRQPQAWAQAMENLHSRVYEIVRNELILV